MKKLGTCCQILDDNAKQYKNTVVGVVKQATLDKLLVGDKYKELKATPKERLSLLQQPLLYKKCHDKVLSKVKQNLQALKLQLQYVSSYPDQMKMFRISSNLLPMFDHPQYSMLYDDKIKTIVENGLAVCKKIIDKYDIVVTTHPDQYVVINSENKTTRLNSFSTLCYHSYFMSKLTTPDKSCINIHATGALDHIPELDNGWYSELLPWLSFENDGTDKKADVRNTLAMCQKYNIKMVYDVHHDLCENSGESTILADDMNIFNSIVDTWKGNTPIFHVSDSRDSSVKTPSKLNPHSDYIVSKGAIDAARTLLRYGHVEVEAKDKNLAVKDLYDKLRK